MPELYIETGPLEGQTFLLSPERPTLLVGRGDGGVQVDVDLSSYGGAVSRRHCQLRLDSRGGLYVVDLGSRNGTTVDEQALAPEEELVIVIGARIHLAPPDGPTMLLRQRSSAWDGAEEELELLRRELRELRSSFESLRRDRDNLAIRLNSTSGGQAVAEIAGPGIDWAASQRALTVCKSTLDELGIFFTDHGMDGRALSLLMKAKTNLGELTALLSNRR